MWVTKLLISPGKKGFFAQKQPNLAFLSIAGSFGALLVGWLVVVARGLYLARHLFTVYKKVLITNYIKQQQCPFRLQPRSNKDP